MQNNYSTKKAKQFKPAFLLVILLSIIAIVIGILAACKLDIKTASSIEANTTGTPQSVKASGTDINEKSNMAKIDEQTLKEATPEVTKEVPAEIKKEVTPEATKETIMEGSISSGTDKLEKDLKEIIQNESGIYSIAYQSIASKSGIMINPKKMQSASIIKVFVMIEAFDEIAEGKINENDKVVLLKDMKVGGSGSLANRKDGTEVTISQLINLMITQSDNTAANILIDILTMDNINACARKMGCTDTIIQRKMMDFKAQSKGRDNFTSVSDLSNIFLKIYKNECLGSKYDTKMIEILKKQENNTKIPSLLPEGTVVAHKTGELDRVENDAGIVFSKDGDYILCILSSGVGSGKAKSILSEISRITYNFNSMK